MPRRELYGIIDGFQLWVNLPSVQKKDRPRYREGIAVDIPSVRKVRDGAQALWPVWKKVFLGR